MDTVLGESVGKDGKVNTVPKKERKKPKKPDPTNYYAVIQKLGGPDEELVVTSEVVADRKTELYEKLEALGDITILFIYRGRKINFSVKRAVKI